MPRRIRAKLSCLGTAQLYPRNPIVIAWWSAAFPGFGHILLNMHLKGNLFFIFEIVINVNMKLNLAMVYTFCGKFESAKQVLNTRWALLYIPFYIFCLWDSYRSTIETNKLYSLAKQEILSMKVLEMTTYEICYLDKRKPYVGAFSSFFMSGLGQIYTRRNLTAIPMLIWTLVITYFSRDLESFQYLIRGDFTTAVHVLDLEWFLFLPSLVFGTSYDAYASTIEQNQLFIDEQTEYFRREWQPEGFSIDFVSREGDYLW
ncbi:MAG: hypothetical protein ACE3JK_05695 [Sporolactobacillus sp.]